MNWYDYIIIYLFSIVTILISILSYGKLSNNKFVLNFKCIIILVLSGLCITLNTYFISGASRAFIGFLVILIDNYFIYGDDLNSMFINTSLCYLLELVIEIVFSILLIPSGVISLKSFDKNILLKGIFSILTVSLPYFILSINKIRNFFKKIIKPLNKPILSFVLIISGLIALAILSYKFVTNFTKAVYLDNILLLLFFGILVSIIIYNRYLIYNEVKKTEELLELITKYEERNDEYRAYKHELLNNLLTLRSFKNKNSKEFDSTLNELISQYNNKSFGIKNIYKLPIGLKGLIYYKISDIENGDYNVLVNISKQVSINLEEQDHKEYISLCKITGIVLDNAIEAMKLSKDKFLNIEVYNEKKNTIIEVNNSFESKNTDIDKIYNKNYSSKGKNRGLGLYLAKMLLKKSKYLDMEQRVENNIFYTKIYIK